MSSKRVENYRRTTQRLLANEQRIGQAKDFLRTLAPSRRAEFAAWLLADLASELTGADETGAADATMLALEADELKDALLQRAAAGASRPGLPTPGQTSPRAMATPPAATAPSAAAPGFISHATLHSAARLTPPGRVITEHPAGADALLGVPPSGGSPGPRKRGTPNERSSDSL